MSTTRKTGKLLADELEWRSMTRLELAAQLGVSPAMISTITRGRTPVPVPLAAKISRVLGNDLGEKLLCMQAQEKLDAAIREYEGLLNEK